MTRPSGGPGGGRPPGLSPKSLNIVLLLHFILMLRLLLHMFVFLCIISLLFVVLLQSAFVDVDCLEMLFFLLCDQVHSWDVCLSILIILFKFDCSEICFFYVWGNFVCASMFDCAILLSCLYGRQCCDLSVPLIVIVSVMCLQSSKSLDGQILWRGCVVWSIGL